MFAWIACCPWIARQRIAVFVFRRSLRLALNGLSRRRNIARKIVPWVIVSWEIASSVIALGQGVRCGWL